MSAEQQPPNPFSPPPDTGSWQRPVPQGAPAQPVWGQPVWGQSGWEQPVHPGWGQGVPPVAPGQPGAPGYPGYQAYPGWSYAYPYALPPRNGLGTAALVLGVIAAALCWTFFVSPLALVLGVLALILGLVGAARARQGRATNRAVALGGAWTGAGAGLVAAVLTVLLVVWALSTVHVSSDAGSEYLAEAGNEVVFEDGVTVTFTEPRHDAGERAVIVQAEITNHGDGSATIDRYAFSPSAVGEEIRERDVRVMGSAPGTLEPGETTSVSYRVLLPTQPAYLSVDFSPGGDYEYGYWELALPSAGAGNGRDEPDEGTGGLEA